MTTEEIKLFRESYNNNSFFISHLAQFKLTNLCNMKCLKCSYMRDMNSSDFYEWSLNDYKIAIDKLSSINTRKISFNGGEVTLKKDLPFIINYALKKGIKSKIATNGLQMTKSLANELISAGLHRITFSIDSHNSELHDYLTKKGAWEKIIEGVGNLIEERDKQKSSIKISVATVIYNRNILDLAKICQLAIDLKVDEILYLILLDYNKERSYLRPTEEQIDLFYREVKPQIINLISNNKIKLISDYFWGETKTNNYNEHIYYDKIACLRPWRTFHINLFGDVFPCCYLTTPEYCQGNILKDDLLNILNSVKFKNFRASIKPPIENPICKKCFHHLHSNTELNSYLNLDTIND